MFTLDTNRPLDMDEPCHAAALLQDARPTQDSGHRTIGTGPDLNILIFQSGRDSFNCFDTSNDIDVLKFISPIL